MVKSPLPLTHYGLGPHRPQSHQNIARLNTEAEAYSKVIFALRAWIKAQGRIHEYQISSPKGKVHLSKRGKWQGQKIIWQFSRMHQKKESLLQRPIGKKTHNIILHLCVNSSQCFSWEKRTICLCVRSRQAAATFCMHKLSGTLLNVQWRTRVYWG